MIGMSQFILPKELHFLKAINAIFALLLKNQNCRVEGTGENVTFAGFSGFLVEYRGKVTICPVGISAYVNMLLK